MSEDADPFALPERWVHADASPTWSQLGEGAVAFVRWRLDRWSSLERLRELDRATREMDREAVTVGLHLPKRGADLQRVRTVLLARGSWTPTGLVDEAEGGDPPGTVTLVVDGEIVDTFGPGTPVEAIVDHVQSLDRSSSPRWEPRGDAPGPWPLAFPHDVDVGGSRVAVADTGHHRVLVARPGGDILHLVGDGVPDHRDGELSAARFHSPRSLCWRGEELLVADTGNDRIRSVDPVHGEVTTIAHAPEGSLPVGLTERPTGEVIVALPGEGQLARLEEDDLAVLDECSAVVEHPVDLAQRGERLLVADLAGPSIEAIGPEGSADTLAEGGEIVEPLGVFADDRVLVADAGRGEVLAFEAAGDGSLGPSQGVQAPAALDREGERFVVADGGGHHLWRLLASGEASPARIRLTESPLSLAEHIRLDPVEMAPGGRLELSISYMLSGGTDPDEVQPPTARGPVVGLSSPEGPVRQEGRIRTEVTGQVAGSGNLRIRWSLTEGELGHEAAWDLPIVLRPGAGDRLRLALSTSPP